MKKDLFYNWHKRSLEKHTSEVDIDAIWAAIEPEVDVINVNRKKKRRFFFFFTFLCLGAIGLGTLGLYSFNATYNSQHISSSPNTNNEEPKQGTQIASIDIDEAINSSSSTQLDKNTNPLTTNIITDPPPINISSPSSILKNDDNQRNIWRHRRSNSTPQVRLARNVNFKETKTPVNLFTQKTTSESLAQSDSTSETPEADVNNVISRTDISIPTDLPLADLSNLEEPKNDLPTIKVEKTKQSSFRLSLSAYSGLAVVQKKLNQKNTSDSGEVLILRNGTEESLELWNNGLRLKLAHKSGFHFSLGLQYARLAENFQYDTEHVMVDSVDNQVVGYSNNLLGDRSQILGFAPNNTLFDLEYDFYNNYHFIELPISVGYQKQMGFWNVGIRGTYVHNLAFETKGRILNSPFEVIDLKSETDSPFRQNLKASYELGLSVGYRISPRIDLGLEGFYRNAPATITSDDYQLDQKYSWGGLNASLNYHF